MHLTQLSHHKIIWPVVEKWLPPAPARVLDAGCGEGQLSYRLAELGHSVTGIDLPGPSLGKARALLASSDYRWDIIAGSVEEFSGVSHAFDVVVSIEVIEHLYRPVKFLNNMAGALRPGGILILSTPYHGWLKNVAISTLGLWDRHHQALDEGNHIKFWSKRTLNAALLGAGFEAVEWLGVGRVPFLWKSILVKAIKPGS
jgi:2-polyprenyl-6-hydroxyphenyl methylase/3-demethylubiquinone-9 3-methyltransferase